MKKKWISILVAALFLSTAGAFYFEGRPDNVSANEEQVKEEIKRENADYASKGETTEAFKETSIKNLNKVEEPVKEEMNRKTEKELVKDDKPEEKEAKAESKPETIKDEEGYTYHLIEDKKKYSNIVHLIDAAASIDASLYGIKNSDVFALIKNGKSVGGFSTGTLSIDSEYKSFALQMHSFYVDKGIEENIDLAIRTGASISVTFEEYTGYHIQYKDGSIIINH